MKSTLLVLPILIVACVVLEGQHVERGADNDGEHYTASVQVIAFDTRGAFLGRPDVRLFESEGHKDMASAFHAGGADHIPFGIYRMEAYVSGYYSEARYVVVYRPRVTVVVGLPFGFEGLTLPVPPELHGKVVGSLPRGKKAFVKLVSVYSSQSLEAQIDPNGEFDFSIPQDGQYLLLVVGEGGLLATRAVTSPYTGPPLEIEIGLGAHPAR
jgi:hypothetical protein